MSHQDARVERARREKEQSRLEAAARERQAVRVETARYQVLAEELESLLRDAEALSVTVPRARPLLAVTSSEIAQQNAELLKVVAETRARIQIAHAGVRSARQLQDYFSGLQELDIPTPNRSTAAGGDPASTSTVEPPAAVPLTSGLEIALARADRCNKRLAPGAQLSADAVAIIASLAAATPELAVIVVQELQMEVSRINREAKHRQALVDRLIELDVRARALGDRDLMREVLFVRGEHAGLTDMRLDDLAAQIADAEDAAARVERANAEEADREHVRSVLSAALASQGYEVVSGFESAIPSAGVLLRKPGYDYHAVQATVEGQLISLDVVRTTLEADIDMSETRDYEAHVALHADMRKALDRIRAEGVVLGRVRELEPGDAPVVALAAATKAPAASRVATRPKERSL